MFVVVRVIKLIKVIRVIRVIWVDAFGHISSFIVKYATCQFSTSYQFFSC